MKKNFALTSAKHKPDRVVELVKADINKYVARERRKELPDGVDFWDFECRCGASDKSAESVHVTAIGKEIDKAYKGGAESVYVEILSKPGHRLKKPRSVIGKNDDEDDDYDGYGDHDED